MVEEVEVFNMVEANKTYVGVVEDNQDPEKMGRVKVRVMDVFDEIDVEDIPWAMPWKDLNGNQFNTPEKGKVVMVVFDQGNPDSPEFIYADHYNINLENKLKSLSSEDYTSMKSLIFDHKTQVYVNDSEGLKIDYKYNNLNITENGIDLNLKDNNLSLNLGDSGASQQAILGNHWMSWFDKFVDNLLGAQAGPYFGNLGAPIIPSPALANVLLEYKTLRNKDFLSEHVNIVDNNKVKTVLNSDREDEPQYGDKWVSTKEENNITELKDEEFKPEEPEEDPNVEIIISYLEEKGYKVNDDIGILNILALRNKDNGVITNKFDDIIYILWKKENGNWNLLEANITTVPGFIEGEKELFDDEKILVNAQYVDELELYEGDETYLFFKDCHVYINTDIKKYNWKSEKIKTNGVKITTANTKGSQEDVFETAINGAQVFKSVNQYNQFINLCRNQINKWGKKTFTYTLVSKNDFEMISNKPSLPKPPSLSASVTTPNITEPTINVDDQQEVKLKSLNEYKKIVNIIKSIYLLNDRLNDKKPLFGDFKGFFNDDEEGATNRLKEVLGLKTTSKKWFNKLSIEDLIPEHKSLFKNQLNSLINQTNSKKGKIKFNIPNLTVGEVSKFVEINTDF